MLKINLESFISRQKNYIHFSLLFLFPRLKQNYIESHSILQPFPPNLSLSLSAMDANLSSRKRKLLPNPSHPLLGRVSTRSTSQIHLHRNRSGRSRAFLAIPPSPKQPRTLPNRDDDGDADLCILIKDLRARRVYSPNSIDASKLSTLNIEESCADDAKAAMAAAAEDINETDAIICSVLKEYPVEDAKLDLGISCETLNSEKKGESDDSNELIVQTTPPDAEVFDNNGEVNENQVKPPSVGEAFGANIDNNNKKNDSISKTKSVRKAHFIKFSLVENV
jgi:hypothetical protein